MTSAAQGDKLTLVNAGTVQPGQRWRGGLGCLIVTGLSGTPNFEMQADDGVTWVPVKELGTGVAISAIAAAAMWLFCVPACTLRLSAGGGAMNATVVGV